MNQRKNGRTIPPQKMMLFLVLQGEKNVKPYKRGEEGRLKGEKEREPHPAYERARHIRETGMVRDAL